MPKGKYSLTIQAYVDAPKFASVARLLRRRGHLRGAASYSGVVRAMLDVIIEAVPEDERIADLESALEWLEYSGFPTSQLGHSTVRAAIQREEIHVSVDDLGADLDDETMRKSINELKKLLDEDE